MEFNATFIIVLISFLVFTFMMNKIFYAPLSRIKSDRENIINDEISRTDSANSSISELNQKKELILNDALSKSRNIISAQINDANLRAGEMLSDAREDYSNTLAENNAKLKSDEADVRLKLDNVISELSGDIVSKVLR